MMSLSGILTAANFMLIIFALVFSVKVLRDKTKKDYIKPWKFVFVALIFFFVFEIIGILEQMGLIAWWDLSAIVDVFKAIARIGIVASFLFGLMLEDKHEIVEEQQIVSKMLKTKRERNEIK